MADCNQDANRRTDLVGHIEELMQANFRFANVVSRADQANPHDAGTVTVKGGTAEKGKPAIRNPIGRRVRELFAYQTESLFCNHAAS